jgi:hypothetical protein
MGPIVEISGTELAELIRQVKEAEEHGVYMLRVAIDGGVKIKWNEYTWSPPMGTVKGPGN